MPKIILNKEMVVEIKRRLMNGEKHQPLADEFGVARPTITKINKSLTHPEHRDARWKNVDRYDTTIDEMYLPLTLRKMLLNMSNHDAGELIKSLIKKKMKK
jgi:hypothetical protein